MTMKNEFNNSEQMDLPFGGENKPKQMDLPLEGVDSPEQLPQVEHKEGDKILGPKRMKEIGKWAVSENGRLIEDLDYYPLTDEQRKELDSINFADGRELMKQWAEEYKLQNEK